MRLAVTLAHKVRKDLFSDEVANPCIPSPQCAVQFRHTFPAISERQSGKMSMQPTSGRSPYCGIVVPTVTPFDQSGMVDAAAVQRTIDFLIAAEVDGIFVLGTTGEGPSIEVSEKLRLVEAAVAAANQRLLIYASVSDHSLRQSIQSARDYAKLGVQAIAAHPPWFFPLSSADIERYFLQLADGSPLPLVMYNMPKTTHISIPLEVIERLANHENIVGIKDSDGSDTRMTDLLRLMSNKPNFSILSGSGAVFAHALKNGAHGLVPSTANLHPAPYVAMYRAAMKQQWDEVDRCQAETAALTAVIQQGRSLSDSLASLKAHMASHGLCGPTVLPPLSTIPSAL